MPNTQVGGWDTATNPRPADSITNPSPVNAPIYTVAWFHTHTATTYRTASNPTVRPVGPSPNDFAWGAQNSIAIPGYAYDYVESPAGSGSIPFGYQLNGPAKVYTVTPPTNRATP